MDKQSPQVVSTEAQRLALEAMSAQLVHKLNAMIAEQEARTRAFAKEHHTAIELPQVPHPPITSALGPEKPKSAPQPPPAPRHTNTRSVSEWETHDTPTPQPKEQPLLVGPKKQTAKPEEESNIGLSMIIFSLVGIVILLRSCS